MSITQNIYEKLVNEEDARLCAEIDEQACRESPKNFGLLLASYFATKLGDAVASPKTTLAWLTTSIGAPAFVLGLLVPIRESGSLVPQLLIGGWIRSLPVRKWVWVAGSIVQAACIAGLGLVALSLEGTTAGLAILGLVTLFSLARGFCSVAAKDVLGKTIPKRVRGQLTGWSASAAGLVTIAVGVILMLPVSDLVDTQLIGVLLLIAGALWIAAAAVYSRIDEFAGETGGGRSIFEALGQLKLLVADQPFRRFVMTRALLMCSALSAPFYVALAQDASDSSAALLGSFVAAGGFASLLSAPLWGRFADQTSRMVMVAAATLTSGTGLLTFGALQLAPGLATAGWFLPAAYFLLSIAHSGVRVGRKTYVVDLATGNKRTDYVAISNSVIGVLLLLAGGVGALSPVLGNDGVIALLALMGLAGAFLGSTLPETDESGR